jgi:hypothetical protein
LKSRDKFVALSLLLAYGYGDRAQARIFQLMRRPDGQEKGKASEEGEAGC